MKTKITRPEILLLVLTVVLTVSLALALIRWIAPTLLGVSSDLVLVKSDKKVPPFYDNIFREEHWSSKEYILQDPIVRVRAKPLYPDIGAMGPNDLLGFRNMSVPVAADVIVIGDSQTYGNNAFIWENWPHSMQAKLPSGVTVYSMATGGWTALQYYYVFLQAPVFSPKVIVIAFYTGNDPLESYTFAIASDLWKEFLPERDIKNYGTPAITFPAPENEQWPVVFSDGVKTIFTPKLRHSSNLKHPAIDAGYEIMYNVAAAIAREAKKNKLSIIFTIIPTKEYVYSEKLKQSEMTIDADYQILVDDETIRINKFSSLLKGLDGAEYVDVTAPLKKSAMGNTNLYPENSNGHPIAAGYSVIASAVTPVVRQHITPIGDGYFLSQTQSEIKRLIYIEEGKFWFIDNAEQVILNEEPEVINTKRLNALLYAGSITIRSKE